jgi:DNA polymerase III epsilon subunit-like protein
MDVKTKWFISLDIETTGPDPFKDQILQLAMVAELPQRNIPVEELPSVSYIIDNGRIKGSPYALALNSWILEILSKPHSKASLDKMRAMSIDGIIPVDDIGKVITGFVRRLRDNYPEVQSDVDYFDKNYGYIPLRISGKNAAGFDVMFLKVLMRKNKTVEKDLEKVRIFHRVLDPGSFIFNPKEDEWVPSFVEINEKLKLKDVSHDALEDARDVIRAFRIHFGLGDSQDSNPAS